MSEFPESFASDATESGEARLRSIPLVELLQDADIQASLTKVLTELQEINNVAATQCIGEPSITDDGEFVAGFQRDQEYTVFVCSLTELKDSEFILKPLIVGPFGVMTFRDGSDTAEVQGVRSDGRAVMAHFSNPLQWEVDLGRNETSIEIFENGQSAVARSFSEIHQEYGVDLPTHAVLNQSRRK